VRVAVVSDIHGNLAALEAVLTAVDADPPDQIWCLGDIVGYGARPNECCALVRDRAAVCLAGNHDLAVRGTIQLEDFSGDAGIAAAWTREVLTEDMRTFLDGLESQAKVDGAELYHGSARDPVWEYVLSDESAVVTLVLTEAPVVLVGHSHVALHVSLRTDAQDSMVQGGLAPQGTKLSLADARWLLNPGSVGQPRDGDPHAAWLDLDLASHTASFERVEYDIERTQQEIRAAGLPEVLARRLEVGS
jgi:diadenosine tetraphosphatase ApaH/serine/threonine PP2A family protein phosphatase